MEEKKILLFGDFVTISWLWWIRKECCVGTNPQRVSPLYVIHTPVNHILTLRQLTPAYSKTSGCTPDSKYRLSHDVTRPIFSGPFRQVNVSTAQQAIINRDTFLSNKSISTHPHRRLFFPSRFLFYLFISFLPVQDQNQLRIHTCLTKKNNGLQSW